MKKVVLAAAMALALYACDNSTGEKEKGSKTTETEQKEGNNSLMSEVMEAHDKYMPKMDDLHMAEENLQTAIDSLQNEEEPDEELIAELEKIQGEIQKAGEGMMAWMKGFKKPGDDMKNDEVQEYLEQQKKLMQDVGRKMDESLQKADSALTQK